MIKKNKKTIAIVLIAAIVIACVGIAIALLGSHEHSFGEWETKFPATCESAEIQARKCRCGEEETREGDPAADHSYISISAECVLEKPMATMVVTASDLQVTGTCGECGESYAIADGIELENAALALGENTVTVKYGALSTTVTIQAAAGDIVLDGTVVDDTYIYSSNKDSEYSDKKEMGTKLDLYRTYFRVNISNILENELFLENKDNAKVQLILAVTGGKVTDETTFKFKVYTPAAGVTDVDFSKLTWNSVDNSTGKYSDLHWSNGTVLFDEGAGHNVSVENGHIIIKLCYSQIVDYVDGNGNILFAFATNTKGLKIGSLENKTENNLPAFKVILNDEHFHIFDQEVADEKYFVSANCKEKTKYYVSCSCGAAGTETFDCGGVIDHTYGEAIPEKLNTCTTAGVKEHYQCGKCGKYFLYRDGQMKLVKAEDVKLSAGHNYKEIPQKDATCTEAGNYKYYKCGLCGKYFDAQKNETTKEAQKIQKLEHTYGEAIPEKLNTCTTAGVKEHYQCGKCGKYFLYRDGQMKLVKAEDVKLSAGHDYKEIPQKDATCTEAGNYKYYKCGLCGKYFDAQKNETTKEAQKIQKLGHTYGDLIPEQAKSCTQEGVKAHYECEACGKTFLEKDGEKILVKAEDVKLSAGHDYKEIPQKDATCTEAGNHKYYKCGLCGKYFDAQKNETTKEAQKIQKLGHTYGDLIPGQAKSCTEDGVKAHYQCEACGKTFLEKDGEKVLVKAEDLIISAGHDTKVIGANEPTCTKDGNNKYYQCKVCGKYFTDKEGTVETTKEEQKLPKVDHTYSDLIPEQAKSCAEDGVKAHYQCEACGKTFLEKDGEKVLVKAEDLIISAGHDTKVIGANEPTCTKDGNNKYYQCKVCGKYFTDKEGTVETTKEEQKLPKMDHTYSDLIPEQAKSCAEDGVKAHYECEACGKTFLEKDGEKVLVKAEDLIISAGHDTKVIGANEPTCTKDGNNKYYQCKVCGKYFTDKEGTVETTKDAQKVEALGHSYTSISAASNMDNPMATMVVKAGDLSVTGTCGSCGESVAIVEGIELEEATLALGENTVTVKYGALSTTVTIEATELYIVLDGTVTDDTYVYSSGKSKEYTDREELGTYSSSYRAYVRVNVSNILENELFLANRENAKLQLVLAVTSGSILDSTNFTLKAYAPAAGGTDAPFSALTWNSVDNKEGSIGVYSQLHWNNGVVLSPDVRVENSKVIMELSCDQISDYIDQDGNILFAFATNTSGLKVGSIENTSNKPSVKVVIDGNVSPVRYNALKMMVLPYQQSKHRCFDILEVL